MINSFSETCKMLQDLLKKYEMVGEIDICINGSRIIIRMYDKPSGWRKFNYEVSMYKFERVLDNVDILDSIVDKADKEFKRLYKEETK